MNWDLQKAEDKPPAIVQVAQSNDHLDDYRVGRPPALASAVKLPEATDIGQVSDMKLPAGFVPGKENSGGGSTAFFKEFHNSADPKLQVYFEYRGHAMSSGAAKDFHDLLAKPAHNLAQPEINQLRELLQAQGDPNAFQITTAKTEDINGKRVLQVEGDYTKYGLRARTLYVDADKTGGTVQQITFQAPTDTFKKNIGAGSKSLESIHWK